MKIKSEAKEREKLSLSQHFLWLFCKAIHFDFTLSLTNYAAALVTTCSLTKPAFVQVWQLTPKLMARTQSHNDVTLCECPMVTHSSRQYISHLSECKVKVAIFIEQKLREI